MIVRTAAPADAPEIHAIYRHYAQNTAITFADHAPSAAEYAAQIADPRYPFLVAEYNGSVLGFAYAGMFRTKEAFRWDAEVTIYLAPDFTGRGVGASLLLELMRRLKQQGYLNAYACITLPNDASVSLHRKCGFSTLGVFPSTGYKLGKWHDVLWMCATLGAFRTPPDEPSPYTR